jgi:hypothetical protein
MPVIDTIAKRMQALRDEGQPDVYTYDTASPKLRAQVIHILNDSSDALSVGDCSKIWEGIQRNLLPEIGKLSIDGNRGVQENLSKYILKTTDEEVFIFIDIAFRIINVGVRGFIGGRYDYVSNLLRPDQAIQDLNERLRENKCGYQFEVSVNKLMPISAEFTHAKIVRPALGLLGQDGFEEANRELLTAFDHIVSGDSKDAITAAARAFEAAMKAICKKRDWEYRENMRATDLIKVCRAKGLFPEWLDEGLSSFVAMMNTGVPGIRNKAGAHGSSDDFERATRDLAMYAIHEATATILLFLERDKALG